MKVTDRGLSLSSRGRSYSPQAERSLCEVIKAIAIVIIVGIIALAIAIYRLYDLQYVVGRKVNAQMANPGAPTEKSENLSEGAETGHQQPAVTGSMESYLKAISRSVKK